MYISGLSQSKSSLEHFDICGSRRKMAKKSSVRCESFRDKGRYFYQARPLEGRQPLNYVYGKLSSLKVTYSVVSIKRTGCNNRTGWSKNFIYYMKKRSGWCKKFIQYMKKTIRLVKTFKIVKRSCSLNRYCRVFGLALDISVLRYK